MFNHATSLMATTCALVELRDYSRSGGIADDPGVCMASKGFSCCRRIRIKEDELNVMPGIAKRVFALECAIDDEVLRSKYYDYPSRE